MWNPPESAPLDGTPVLWLWSDGMSALVMFWANGSWYEVWEEIEEGRTNPQTNQSDMKDCVWAHLPPKYLATCSRLNAELWGYISKK